MDWNVIQQFITPELLIMIVVCYCLGLFLKSVPRIPDWLIPIILLLVTCVVTMLYIAIILKKGFGAETFLMGFIYGLLSSAVAVYGNQVIKQVKKK